MAVPCTYGADARRRFRQDVRENRSPTHLKLSPFAMSLRDVIPQRPLFVFTHVREVTAIIAALVFLVGFWFGVSMYRAPRPSYPYYDTQKPVPPWSEPMRLQGNHDQGKDHK